MGTISSELTISLLHVTKQNQSSPNATDMAI